MSNGSAELPQNAIRRIISTVETIQSLFPELWVDADTTDNSQQSASRRNTESNIPNGSWKHVEKLYPQVHLKQSRQTDCSWPSATMKDDMTPENPHTTISRLMSTAATNQLLFPELWDSAGKVEQKFLTDKFQATYESLGIWSHNQQKHIDLPMNHQNNQELLSRRERVDRSEDEDSSDSGICSGTYLA